MLETVRGFLNRPLTSLLRSRPAPDDDYWYADTATESASGVTVTPESALRCAVVYACIRVLAESVASLPLNLYRRRGQGREKAIDHPLYALLHDAPNPEMTSFMLRETVIGHLCLRGNAYLFIERDGRERIMALWPLPPDRVEVTRKDRQLVYKIRLRTGPEPIKRREMLHIRGLSGDGVSGYGPIAHAREAVGLSLAAEGYGARFFSNDSRPGGVLEHPGELGEDAHKNIRESWKRAHSGYRRAFEPAILEEGMTWKQIGVAPEDAQFLETRRYQVAEICRIFRVPPHLVQDLSRATYSNVAEQSREFLKFSIAPWLERIEQEIEARLLTADERADLYVEHNAAAMLRGDPKERAEYYANGRQWGWLSANDVRELENLPPLPDTQGDVYLIPVNMVTAETPPTFPEGGGDAAGEPDDSEEEDERTATARREVRARRDAARRRALGDKFLDVFREVAERVIRRERNDILAMAAKTLAKGDRAGFISWLVQFYDEHEWWLRDQVRPTFRSFAGVIGDDVAGELDLEDIEAELNEFLTTYIEAFAVRHVTSSRKQLQALARDAEDPAPEVERRLQEWEERRPEKIARRETVQLANATTLRLCEAAGRGTVRWVAAGRDPCPYCRELDGTTVDTGSAFVVAGAMSAAGAAEALTVKGAKRHPPLHQGCECQIIPD